MILILNKSKERRNITLNKKEIENQIEALEKERLEAIKHQNYSLVAKNRDKLREMMYQLRAVD
ncbi:hypothetical protein [Brumimicrobium aurantiacum]|uniref:UVR domain-containing protein n=1 Tax=Brumimicrobium aurantiacum TaxID=1737063 RepID=A0A3E1EWK4_9FLAO|nr:hypothetical protein [Brumimicrobium aurantiacum]RFC53940.1 hypothetical protein DXU93_10355 [Brumimicrobium aurantiacum]